MAIRNSFKIIIRKDFIRQNGTAALCLQAFIEGKKVVLPLNIHVRPDQYNQIDQQITAGTGLKLSKKEVNDLNLLLGKARARASDIFVWNRLNDSYLTVESFKKSYSDTTGRMDFLAFMEATIKEWTGIKETSTIKSYGYVMEKLKKFSPQINFSQVTTDFIMRLDRYLTLTEKININSRWKYHKIIKTFINHAIKKGIPITSPYLQFKIKKGHSERDHLSLQELYTLMDLLASGTLTAHVANVLEYFIFSCFTGLRISDISQVTSEMITENHLIFAPQKTKGTLKILKIPLHEMALSLISGRTGKLFKVTYRTNIYLKDIARTAGISKNLSFHVARHTFASIFLESGGSVEVLKELLGQSKIETTMVYVHIGDSRKKEQMKDFSTFLAAGKK